ncbi:3-isopropylmalate dehydratase small subunit [Luteimonas composti]|uniref:3-isopropylmalate dehydratase n=1 Tax=Luteimonas composti TaxID=398257 RepID=A0ABT6MNP6_9GAMM|nr:3-isopropylmalate dehydratase small subunit [Luteimonas composti]MDH7452209.1 3-isopropylmalate dehydratase small subunit [Luteimonas composti]
MSGWRHLRSRSVVLAHANIDTDQILPARFLTTTSREGLGRHAFHDWRWRDDGTLIPGFPFDQPGNAGRSILLAGANFGCGSSREHAPWALADLGVRVVVSTGIADIFRNNCLKNGLLPVELDAPIVSKLMERPDDELLVDLDRCELVPPGGPPLPFALDRFSRLCLLQGLDQLEYLLGYADRISAFEARHATPRP